MRFGNHKRPEFANGRHGARRHVGDRRRRACHGGTGTGPDRHRRRIREQAQHPHDHGRRHRLAERERLQPRDDGLPDAQHRPHRAGGRALHRLVRRAELHRRARRLRHRPVADPHRTDQGRAAGGGHRPAGRRPLRRRGAEVARLRHRPVRQEPPRRQGRVPADQPRLRRVLRQPLPPERRGGAGEPGLSEEPRVPRALRAAGRDQGHRGRAGRGYRAADHQAHGDGRRGVPGRDARLHRPRDRRGHALVRLLQSDPDARLDASEAGVAGRDRARALPRRHGRARRLCRAAAAEARRSRDRRRHHRALHLRQRRRGR